MVGANGFLLIVAVLRQSVVRPDGTAGEEELLAAMQMHML